MKNYLLWLLFAIAGVPTAPAILRGMSYNSAIGESGMRIFNHIVDQMIQINRLRRKTVCYDEVGCFYRRGQLHPAPKSPAAVGARFFLCQNVMARTCVLLPGTASGKKLLALGLRPGAPVKVLIHGYNGRYNSIAMSAAKNLLLKQNDVIVILVDWYRASQGQLYVRTAANAELVGRQTATLLLNLVEQGTNPEDIHIIAFSLGAQVAGFVGQEFAAKKMQLGQITGLDPASFLFERANLPAARKLDHTDAKYVEVIHTDGSRLWADGFGLLSSVGHVDYFPNGGNNQPGCHDSVLGALTFQFKRNENASVVCSHGRVIELYLEAIDPSSTCKFIGLPCPGLVDFQRDFVHGNCFAKCGKNGTNEGCGVIGREQARGSLYLVTRDTKPYCGDQVRASVSISEKTLVIRGHLLLELQHGNHTSIFSLTTLPLDVIEGGSKLTMLKAIEHGSINIGNTPTLQATLIFNPVRTKNAKHQRIFINHVDITDLEGNSWQFCDEEIELSESSQNVGLQLSLNSCNYN